MSIHNSPCETLEITDDAFTLRGVRFSTRRRPKSTVWIVARQDVADGHLSIQLIELAEVCKSRDATVQEACIGLSPSISLYRAVGKLQSQDDCQRASGSTTVGQYLLSNTRLEWLTKASKTHT